MLREEEAQQGDRGHQRQGAGAVLLDGLADLPTLGARERLAEVAEEVTAAAKQAEATAAPALETIFSDVYEQLPAHLRTQGEAAFDLASRKGDAAAGDGALIIVFQLICDLCTVFCWA